MCLPAVQCDTKGRQAPSQAVTMEASATWSVDLDDVFDLDSTVDLDGDVGR